jgi:hypothetical protein
MFSRKYLLQTVWPWRRTCRKLRLKCDGTHAETRFRPSAKRPNPSKSPGPSVQSTTGSRGVRISASSKVVWRVLATHSNRQFPLHFPSRASPCAITFHLDSTFFIGPWASVCLAVRLGEHSGLYCVRFKIYDSFSTVLQRIKQRSVTKFLTYENETSIEIHRRSLAFYGEDIVRISTVRCWMRKSEDIGGNLYSNDKMRSWRPVIANQFQ